MIILNSFLFEKDLPEMKRLIFSFVCWVELLFVSCFPHPNEYIVGGVEADIENFPYQVS